jgi:acetoin utilization protein AcuB
MIAKELVSTEVLPLKTSDTCAEALTAMEDYKVSHLPIVNNRQFLGLVSENDLLNHGNMDDPLGNVKLSAVTAVISAYEHVFDVMKLFSGLKLTLLPVVDNQNNFIGVITLQNLLHEVTNKLSVANPGGIIIVEMSENNYSMSEIAQIVESNDARILSAFVTSFRDSTLIEVTLKINKIDISAVLQTFNRYNYTIKATFSEKDDLDDLKERYDSLMNYLNI